MDAQGVSAKIVEQLELNTMGEQELEDPGRLPGRGSITLGLKT